MLDVVNLLDVEDVVGLVAEYTGGVGLVDDLLVDDEELVVTGAGGV